MKKYDVVIAGGGPTGSTAAKEISKKGRSVLIVEKRKEIGFPNHCSGLVSPDFVSFTKMDSSLILNKIYGAALYSYSNKVLSFKDDKVHAIAIDRVGFDRMLVHSAMENGAKYMYHSSIKNIERINNDLRIYLEGNDEPINTHLLMIASGASSNMLKIANFKSIKGEIIRTLQVEAKIELPDPNIVYVYINNDVAHNWFAWAIPIGNGRARIGLGTDKKENLSTLFDILREKWIVLKGKNIIIESKVAWIIPIGFMNKPFMDNIVVVGDAAREVKPFSGGGLYTGILSAHFAAKTLLSALNKKDYSEKILSHYTKLCDAPIRSKIKRGLILRKIYKSMNDVEKEKFLLSLNNEYAKRIILDYGHIDRPFYVGYKLLKYIKSPLLNYLKSIIIPDEFKS